MSTLESVGPAVRRLAEARRLVVKVGSALLVEGATGRVKADWLASLAADIAGLVAGGTEVIVVSSGAIALGRGVLGLPRGKLKLEQAQAAAAVGQIALARAWSEALGARGLAAAQVLLTLGDTEERRRYLNARSTLGTLIKLNAVPVINENDTVATSEIRYGDNDRLAARVATMASADTLVLLSDIDGLYTAPPAQDPAARHLPVVERITPEIEAMAGGAASELSRGGMRTKVDAAKIAVAAGTAMVIASGKRDHPLAAVDSGVRSTWFLAHETPTLARKTWIAGSLDPRGAVTLDAGAADALAAGRSLLPAGVIAIEGTFTRGDAVRILDSEGRELGRGLVAYDHDHASRIMRRNSREIETILGFAGRAEMIHRDDMALNETALAARARRVPVAAETEQESC
ncbi:glutamate 5-kinase [Segnochrobactrum spirostomi]|uniref:Glutamate 5-kinase n=1 Tax=Segnochrobactrum spirostomi TaxID=2608987 RepID=A0A6A7Y147_9HYPH|nr:glutamate 5-kinase [Segnochrobactrum spirostomi]MQT12780.1 glutamate 5-kinase [Segnochrobactrum spirostomi]